MPSKPVVIATREFASQGEATAFFKEMLNRYEPGQRVAETDFLDLSALLERHPEYAAKVGSGIDHFEVIMTDHGTQCFRVVRRDGTGTDFSYPTCVRGRAPSRKTEVSSGFREAVRIDLYRARDKFFAEHKGPDGLVTCAVTRERIRPDEGHMDHRSPLTFEVIVTTFLASKGIGLDEVPISTGADDQVITVITDDEMKDAFRSYHAAVARLDFVKGVVNLAQSSAQRVRPSRIAIDD
jgi:hypothetical protein